MGSSTVTSPSPTMLLVLLPLVVVSGQDTSYCPDGWDLEWVHSTGDTDNGCRCFLFGPDEAVTRSTADLVCAGHSGSWVAELDHPGINYWMKAQLLKLIPVGERASFWLGGRTLDSHSPHQPGTWTWDAGHLNRTIEWWHLRQVYVYKFHCSHFQGLTGEMTSQITLAITKCASPSLSTMTLGGPWLGITSGMTLTVLHHTTTSASLIVAPTDPAGNRES